MAGMMGGVDVMGGPATGLLRASTATEGTMSGMQHEGMQMPPAKPPAHQHGGKAESAPLAPGDMMQMMMALHQRMMADSTIRMRIMADTVMRRMMSEMMRRMAKPDSVPPHQHLR
jgi:hypothetical protein